MSNATVKKMFPGAVTSRGFFSYYSYIIGSEAEHIFVIKGGPGVGKSTFMNKIGQEMLARGLDIELHCCSSDNNSIDGLVIPDLNIALLDGTAPHIVDPKNPGAVDEIINLGEYWDPNILRAAREHILTYNSQVSRYFQAVYFALKEAQIALNEWKFYVSAYQNWNRIDEIYLQIENSLFKNSTKKKSTNERHLFAWAHSPQGKINYIDSLLSGIKTIYTISGQPGSGKSTLMKRISERARILDMAVEFYHNTLDPDQLDLIIIPQLKTALVSTSYPYPYAPNIKAEIIALDLDIHLNQAMLNRYTSDIENCHQRIDQHLNRAKENSQKAKHEHDLMESYYIPAMNFTAIEEKRQSVLETILHLSEQEKIAVSKTDYSTILI